MASELHKRSDIERKLASGEAVKEQPRQPIRETSTGRLISNQRVPEMLPTYLIAMQSNTLIYNDVDVEAFQWEVRQQVTRILDAIRDERFENAGITYQQFIDLYDGCFEMPSEDELRAVKHHGTRLYAVLEHHGNRLSTELGIKNLPDGEAERRFNAVTEAHINLFFYMLTLNLAIHNKIDNVQKQLRTKLGLLEERLRTLLREYIYADSCGNVYHGEIDKSKTLYGWILLTQNDLDTAWDIYSNDLHLKNNMSFAKLHNEVMSIYHKKYSSQTPVELRSDAFRGRKLSDDRVKIALQLCRYLEQTAQIRQYIDELTQGSENDETEDATVDVRSLLIPRNS
ncbi:hypothetical protein F9U39_15810 [Pectobacterium versatile]|uniref:Uncharacterized protein n=2 Tax=Pectobacterium TaxID=122277 RepID=A0AAW3SW61_9GAMM|nr:MULTISPECIES: hypothetical protein [Pectobacterium]MBA5204745.1 hypothetical protein [Pectobacterium aroidearum]MBN3170966.1 hypothetical protein [Pectobacterium brasiliense]MBN3176395.1 hypothetical protein [Pectobacterium parmentieri]MBQ4790895.1 hypothetical protein [Pectobacterium versatile]QHQ23413.1 hypothetical protein GMX10_04470 [Pectobacterium parvum]